MTVTLHVCTSIQMSLINYGSLDSPKIVLTLMLIFGMKIIHGEHEILNNLAFFRIASSIIRKS
jgi:hypothetical protein